MPVRFIKSRVSIPWLPASAPQIGAADFNGDGHVDLILTAYDGNRTGHPITILAGNGRGTFTDITGKILVGGVPRTIHPRELAIGDVNGDGKADIFIADHGYDHDPFPGATNILLVSVGRRLVNVSSRLPQLPDFTHATAMADVTGNGRAEILVGNQSGQRNIGPYLLTYGNRPIRLAAGLGAAQTNMMINKYDAGEFMDLNGDGRQDLVLLAHPDTGRSHVLINPGNGQFARVRPITLPPGPGFPVRNAQGRDVAAIDFNKDGLTDILLLTTNRQYRGTHLRLLQNMGNGRFVDRTQRILQTGFTNGEENAFLSVVDIDLDGDMDVIAQGGPNAYLYTNSYGTFRRQALPAFDTTNAITDIDHDGDMDVVNWNFDNGSLNVFRNTAADVLANKSLGTAKANVLSTRGAGLMVGGAGDDTYRIDHGGDKMVEYAGEGRDTAVSTVSLALPEHVEILRLAGSAVIGAGNRDNNLILGNARNNSIRGGAGADVLVGGQGRDTFLYARPEEGYDTIRDFTPGEIIQLRPGGFAGIGRAGRLSSTLLEVSATGTATRAETRLVFSTRSQTLSYDRDGSGPGVATSLCRLVGQRTLSASAIVVG